MKKILLLALLGGALMTSCKKSGNTDCPETADGMAGSYKISKVTLNGEDWTDDNPCLKSAIFTFNADGTGSYTEVGTGCNTIPETGTWTIVNSVFDADFGSVDEGTLVNNCSSITLSQSDGGITYVVTLAKQ